MEKFGIFELLDALSAGTGNAVDGFLTRHEAARKRVKK